MTTSIDKTRMRLLLKEDSKDHKVKYSPRLPDKYRFEEKGTSVLL